MNLSGGRTRDGGDIVGASVFYSHPPSEDENGKANESEIDVENEEIDRINEELKVNTFDVRFNPLRTCSLLILLYFLIFFSWVKNYN